MDAALREEFKRLRGIVVNIHYDRPIREISKSCEVLMEEMRGYGWKVGEEESKIGTRQEKGKDASKNQA